MNEYASQIREAVFAAQVLSPTTYSWFGVRSPRLPAGIRGVLTNNTARSYLLHNLQWQLYNDFYCRGGAQPIRATSGTSLQVGVTPFIEQLQVANSGRGYWEQGWTAVSAELEGGGVAASRNSLTLTVFADERLNPTGGAITLGAELSLRFEKDLFGISPGFYMALGDHPLGPEEIVRLYWHVSPEGAVRLVSLVSRQLNKASLPYNLKVVNDPRRYDRCDTAVLYLRKRDYAAVAAMAQAIYLDLEGMLAQGVPTLTRRLAPGLGLAEDPGHKESFGMQRCMLIAEGLLRAHEAGKKGLEARLSTVLDTLAEAGISIERPYLRPGSTSEYNFGESLGPPGPSPTVPRGPREPEDLLEVADRIARRLVGEAVWHRDTCNWLGATLREPGQTGLTYKALGPDLYGGTAGVALFLGELYAKTRDRNLKRTTLGALDQALSRLDALPVGRLGLYTGKPSIALAAARVGLLLGDEALVRRAVAVAEEVEQESPACEYELLSGGAGAIVGLLALRDLPGGHRLGEVAARFGDELVEAADKSDEGYSWRAHGRRFARNLTGFSHGAAGIGYALLELYAFTGEAHHRTAAEMAFKYERRWFDSAEGNWPDFRDPGIGDRGKGRNEPRKPWRSPFATFWCHGAPGIAVSRLRAYELLGERRYLEDATIALHTTRKWLEASLRSETGDYSLCHGLAGNTEVLLLGSRLPGQEASDTQSLALRVAGAGTERAEARSGVWVCGTGGGEAPGLMLGLAGIGLFYLRLSDSSISSVLLVDQLRTG